MQLGTRWQAFKPAPKQLPRSMQDAIFEVEREIHALKIDASQWWWTLTYLENRPIAQLDDGTTVTMRTDGTVHITESE